MYIYYNRESGRSELVESALHLAKKKKKERKKEKRNKGKRRRRRRKREGKKGVCDGPLSSASALCRPGGEGREGKKRKKGKKTSRQSPLTRWRFSFSTTIHDARSSQRYLSRLLRYTIIYIYIYYISLFFRFRSTRSMRSREERKRRRERTRERARIVEISGSRDRKSLSVLGLYEPQWEHKHEELKSKATRRDGTGRDGRRDAIPSREGVNRWARARVRETRALKTRYAARNTNQTSHFDSSSRVSRVYGDGNVLVPSPLPRAYLRAVRRAPLRSCEPRPGEIPSSRTDLALLSLFLFLSPRPI